MNMERNLPALFSMNDLERMAQAVVRSNLFGIKTPEQAITLMLVAQAEGMHPATAARDYHVIQNRPAMKADAMLARFQQSGGKINWKEYTDTKVSAEFSHPQSPTPVLIEWTLEMAKKIGLTSKDNWKNYPRQMLRARVVSEGVRTCYPAISTGIYTPEEVMDFAPEKDVSPSAGAMSQLSVSRQELLNETAAKVRSLLMNDQAWDAYSLLENSNFDNDEKAAFWSLLDTKQRTTLGRLAEAERANQRGVISPAQHKRLEAQIKELSVDREKVKKWCADRFGVTSFTELTQEQYQELDAKLATKASQMGATEEVQPAAPAARGKPSAEELFALADDAIRSKDWDAARDLARGLPEDKAKLIIERIPKEKK